MTLTSMFVYIYMQEMKNSQDGQSFMLKHCCVHHGQSFVTGNADLIHSLLHEYLKYYWTQDSKVSYKAQAMQVNGDPTLSYFPHI